jgi:3-deoxy-D-manno-octulosonic-acid transferase
MLLLYNAGVRVYFVIVWLASFFNKKAKQWINGRKKPAFIRCTESIWFHFASLGEFEQGRPVLEKLREQNPGSKMVITFFSPSGYEVRKSTPLADAVYYLPLDTAKNARDFIDAIQPKLVVFTKYEYWYHFFNEADKRNIPLYIISGIFRPKQIFFKWYGGLNRKMLRLVTWFFVQDGSSKELLQGIGINNVTVSGDTRFDRVWANAQHPKSVPAITEFKNGKRIFIAGSSWSEDEKLLAALVTEYPEWKFIFAPHEIENEKIDKLLYILPSDSVVKFSQLNHHHAQIASFQVMIIDNIGMLSSLYQYADIAYIGGGFGGGIHNTLEAAAFGLPVIFGPNFERFKEARDLIDLRAGFSISDEDDLKNISGVLIADESQRKSAGKLAQEYVKNHVGATKIIVDSIVKSK